MLVSGLQMQMLWSVSINYSMQNLAYTEAKFVLSHENKYPKAKNNSAWGLFDSYVIEQGWQVQSLRCYRCSIQVFEDFVARWKSQKMKADQKNNSKAQISLSFWFFEAYSRLKVLKE